MVKKDKFNIEKEDNEMKLDELKRLDALERPEWNKRNVDDGDYFGETVSAELVERESNFSDDGTRVVLSIKIEVQDESGDIVDLYVSPNYTWSKKGKMIKILEELDVLPKPGESIDIGDLVGIPVQVLVENTEKNGEIYSNIISIKKVKEKPPIKKSISRVGTKKSVSRLVKISEKESILDKLLDDVEVQEDEDVYDIFEDEDE